MPPISMQSYYLPAAVLQGRFESIRTVLTQENQWLESGGLLPDVNPIFIARDAVYLHGCPRSQRRARCPYCLRTIDHRLTAPTTHSRRFPSERTAFSLPMRRVGTAMRIGNPKITSIGYYSRLTSISAFEPISLRWRKR